MITCTEAGACNAGWRIWLQEHPSPRQDDQKTGRTLSSTDAPDPQVVRSMSREIDAKKGLPGDGVVMTHVGKFGRVIMIGRGYQVVGHSDDPYWKMWKGNNAKKGLPGGGAALPGCGSSWPGAPGCRGSGTRCGPANGSRVEKRGTYTNISKIYKGYFQLL